MTTHSYKIYHLQPIVRYDQLAGRWLVVLWDDHNEFNSPPSGPSYECVAVSQSSDPTAGWYRYDFKYDDEFLDSPRLGVWPDGYYFGYNGFNSSTTSPATGDHVCAWSRAAMLAGPDGNSQAEAQQCFNEGTGVLGLSPANVDGSVPPPAGSPEDLLDIGTSTTGSAIELRRFHVDWVNPANSWIGSSSSSTTPVSVSVNSFSEACNGTGACVAQPSPGNALRATGDRLMDRVVYRNFGDHESLMANHSVNSTAPVGVRWYEIRDPNGTPTVVQDQTYNPADGTSRWMGSVAEDQAQDMALGYSLSSSTTKPSVAWTGRTTNDAPSTMGQGEAVVQSGGGVETGQFPDTSPANVWGRTSDMTVDPADDCTFWYTNEYYPSNGIFNWDTRIAAVKFPGCAASDFSLTAGPARVAQASKGGSEVDTALTHGSAEALSLYVQDLPPGVTASFSPSSIVAGGHSTLKFTASGSTPVGTYTVGVIVTGPSAVHYVTVPLTITPRLFVLSIARGGAGAGSVVSSPAGISCGSVCSHAYEAGTVVALTAKPAPHSRFHGWSGSCSGTATCHVTMSAARTVTANFRLLPPNTAITKSRVDAKHHQASFRFKAFGKATGFQCAIVKAPKPPKKARKPSFRRCSFPKAYTGLKSGRYKFYVRAFNVGGSDRTPATKGFKV